ncbi:MAG TPA: hypothetical protein VF733_02800 [Candidatus Saccharimonadales bacterium]
MHSHAESHAFHTSSIEHITAPEPTIVQKVGFASMKGYLFADAPPKNPYDLRQQAMQQGNGDLRAGIVPLSNDQIKGMINFATGPARSLRCVTAAEWDDIYNHYDTGLLTDSQLALLQEELSNREKSDEYVDKAFQRLAAPDQTPAAQILRFLGLHLRADGKKLASDNLRLNSPKNLPLALNIHHSQAYDRRALDLMRQNGDLVYGHMTVQDNMNLKSRTRDRLFGEHAKQQFDEWLAKENHEIGRKIGAGEELPAWAQDYYGPSWPSNH